MTGKSSTSDDLEGSIRTARRRSCVFRSPPPKIWKKIDACYQQQKCSPRSLLSGGIRFMEILEGVA